MSSIFRAYGFDHKLSLIMIMAFVFLRPSVFVIIANLLLFTYYLAKKVITIY